MFKTSYSFSLNEISGPAYKSSILRVICTELIVLLCHDCLKNLNCVMNFLKPMNSGEWRNHKACDWNVKTNELPFVTKNEKRFVALGGYETKLSSSLYYMFMMPDIRNYILNK
jgi:hypothetical protein